MPSPRYRSRKPRSRPEVTARSADASLATLGVLAVMLQRVYVTPGVGAIIVVVDRALTRLDTLGSHWEIVSDGGDHFEALGASGNFDVPNCNVITLQYNLVEIDQPVSIAYTPPGLPTTQAAGAVFPKDLQFGINYTLDFP